MRKLFVLFSYIVCLSGNCSGQDSTHSRVYVGIDLLKNVWPILGIYPDIQSVYTLEPTVFIQLKRPAHYVQITPGFTRFNAKPDVSLLSGQGYYLKVGLAHRKRKLEIGSALVLSKWRDEGTYRLRGSYFGDFVGVVPAMNRTGVGGEGFIGYWLSVTKRLSLRIQYRINVTAPFTDYAKRPYPAFLPGVGLLEGNSWTVGQGITLQLMYKAFHNERR